jgi:hypothetical protein
VLGAVRRLAPAFQRELGLATHVLSHERAGDEVKSAS